MRPNHNIVKQGDGPAYFDEGRGWEADRQARIEKSERRAWLVASGASVIAVVAVIGIASLAPFKRTVPYVFEVDRATGNVELVSAADDRTVVGYQELMDKHWAQKYVVARESYQWNLLQADYDTVLTLSSDEVGRDYAKLYEGPDARDKKYGAAVEMRVTVLSVTLSNDAVGKKAVVRYSKATRRSDSTQVDPPQYFVATLAYAYKPSMVGKEKDLINNPLGYKVTAWRADSEIAPVNVPKSGGAAPQAKQ
jgi:type IV secretion system protein VirB8